MSSGGECGRIVAVGVLTRLLGPSSVGGMDRSLALAAFALSVDTVFPEPSPYGTYPGWKPYLDKRGERYVSLARMRKVWRLLARTCVLYRGRPLKWDDGKPFPYASLFHAAGIGRSQFYAAIKELQANDYPCDPSVLFWALECNFGTRWETPIGRVLTID